MLVRSHSEKEAQLIKRTGKPSEKDVLFNKVQEIFQKSSSVSDFKTLLYSGDIKSYERGGKLAGVYFGKRRYRFKQSLGIDIFQLQLKDKVSERKKLLHTIRLRKEKTNVKVRQPSL